MPFIISVPRFTRLRFPKGRWSWFDFLYALHIRGVSMIHCTAWKRARHYLRWSWWRCLSILFPFFFFDKASCKNIIHSSSRGNDPQTDTRRKTVINYKSMFIFCSSINSFFRSFVLILRDIVIIATHHRVSSGRFQRIEYYIPNNFESSNMKKCIACIFTDKMI